MSQESGDDPFNYRPLKRKRVSSTSLNNGSVSRKRPKGKASASQRPKSSTPRKSQQKFLTQQTSKIMFPKLDISLTGSDKEEEKVVPNVPEYCSLCQMPFALLHKWESKERHASDCLEVAMEELPACPQGITCDTTIRSHYQKFSHLELASHRSVMPCEVQEPKLDPDLPGPRDPSPQPGPSRPNNVIWVSSSDDSPDLLKQVLPEPMTVIPESTDEDNSPDLVKCASKGRDKEKCENCDNEVFVIGSRLCLDCFVKDSGSDSESILKDNQKKKAPEERPDESYLEEVIDKALDKALNEDGDEEYIATDVGGDLVDNRELQDERPVVVEQRESSEELTAGNFDPSAPVKAQALEDDKELEINIRMNPQMQVDRLQLKIPRQPDGSPSKAKQLTINSFFRPKNESKNEVKEKMADLFTRAKNNGFVVPDYTPKDTSASKPSNAFPSKRTCPFYKKIPNTGFTVDAFSYGAVPGISKYFLSHFHYDHYNGLTKHFKHPVVCSEITARLVSLKIRLPDRLILRLPMNDPRVIDDVEVTLLDANHCPGAVMFLFRLPTGQTVLHCGDFRATPDMEPVLRGITVDTVYLDTTYCRPEYDFPPQSAVVAKTVERVRAHLTSHPRTLVLVGSYTIGKERIFTAVAEAIDAKVWCSTEKARVLKTQDNPVIEARLTKDSRGAQVHVVEMNKVKRYPFLMEYLRNFAPKYDHILAITPTGWTHQKGSSSSSVEGLAIKIRGKVSFFEVPYSEHSSYSELERFIRFLKLRSEQCVIPTVNVGSPASRNAMKTIFKKWIGQQKSIRNFVRTPM